MYNKEAFGNPLLCAAVRGGKKVRKFKIPNIPTTESKSIRFPVDVIAQVEEAIRGTNCTFSLFIPRSSNSKRFAGLKFEK